MALYTRDESTIAGRYTPARREEPEKNRCDESVALVGLRRATERAGYALRNADANKVLRECHSTPAYGAVRAAAIRKSF